jgi:hypothetical protein
MRTTSLDTVVSSKHHLGMEPEVEGGRACVFESARFPECVLNLLVDCDNHQSVAGVETNCRPGGRCRSVGQRDVEDDLQIKGSVELRRAADKSNRTLRENVGLNGIKSESDMATSNNLALANGSSSCST